MKSLEKYFDIYHWLYIEKFDDYISHRSFLERDPDNEYWKRKTTIFEDYLLYNAAMTRTDENLQIIREFCNHKDIELLLSALLMNADKETKFYYLHPTPFFLFEEFYDCIYSKPY